MAYRELNIIQLFLSDHDKTIVFNFLGYDYFYIRISLNVFIYKRSIHFNFIEEESSEYILLSLPYRCILYCNALDQIFFPDTD
jgi:hypothetical protein